MHSMDLNLLVALDALLEEESVLRAAKRMHLSAPAMSRTLARIRASLGDPVLVRAGRDLVPTPRAIALRPRVRALVAEAEALLREEGSPALGSITRRFVIRSSDAVVERIGIDLLQALRASAPGVTVRFAPEGDEDVAALREGRVDLDIGVAGETGPEIRVQTLLTDRFVGIMRRGHPLSSGEVTVKRFVEYPHVGVSRAGKVHGPIDEALRKKRLSRTVAAVVPGIRAALVIVARSDLLGAVASLSAASAPELDLVSFPLPVSTPEVVVTQTWHPRFDADPAHRWLREEIRLAFKRAAGDGEKKMSGGRR
ncbi:Transcriptional regulator, LysR family protein [Minicystis rosea]|nr:Transcriptional regulator, LysR family protein [Minicystis rosea]